MAPLSTLTSLDQKYFGLEMTTLFVLIFPLLIPKKVKKILFVCSLTRMELNLPESRDTSSSFISDTVAHVSVPHCRYCKNWKRSTDYSISSESSNNSSILSYLPIFPERTTWQIQSNIVPDSPEKELAESRSQSTPLPTFQLMDTEKSDLSQNFAVLPPLQAHSSFNSSILQSLDPLVRRAGRAYVSEGFY